MSLSYHLSGKLILLNNTLHFFKKHFLVVIGLGLVAAFGKMMQLVGFGQIATGTNILLEVVIESSRILLFLYVLGLANVKSGFLRIKRFSTDKDNRKTTFTSVIQKVRKQWLPFSLNILGFLIIAWCINYLIDLVAYETCLYLT